MQLVTDYEFDLDRVLRERNVVTYFQPQVSARRRAVFGVEALSRGIGEDGAIIPPDRLFAAARQQGRLTELDRLCREEACRSFVPHYRKNRSLLLSLNVDAATIGETTRRSCHLRRLVSGFGIEPNNVVIEIIESQAASTEALLDFTDHYRSRGFLIALDDVGAGHSNLDRIPQVKPDILKMDRSLVSGSDFQFHKREIVRSFVAMCGRLGAMVLAEGVERSGETLALMEAGVDAFQGFYFGKPSPASWDIADVGETFNTLAARFKALAMERIASRKRSLKTCDALMDRMCSGLVGSLGDMNIILSEFIGSQPAVECLYILDTHGCQVSDTICDPDKLDSSRRFLYEPAKCGSDHSLKEYYLPLRAGLSRHTTEPYISLASGNRCITISARFLHPESGELILCADVAQPL